jgi:hypothetical protein
MGGGAIFLASMCDIIGHGHIISVDRKEMKRPQHDRITYVIGRTTATDTLERIRGMVEGKTVMVILDSDHRSSHVKRELKYYGQFVTKGQYMIVEDTELGNPIPWAYPDNPGPKGAIDWFIPRQKNFIVDPLENHYLISMCSGGFLKRVTERPDMIKEEPKQANDTTIVYYTDNSLDEGFMIWVQFELIKAAQGKPIISVSQQPLEFGKNICVGDIGRSHHSLFTQALIGAKAATTKYIALAEHDCLYTPEHFNWIPLDDEHFFYNINQWYVQYKTGEYSHQRRKCMSGLICNRELFIRAVEEKIRMLETGFEIRKGQPGACEPGVCDDRTAFVEARERWYLDQCDKEPSYKDVGKEQFKAVAFSTHYPNLDIRHNGNFSGGRRGKEKTMELPYWGNFLEYMRT